MDNACFLNNVLSRKFEYITEIFFDDTEIIFDAELSLKDLLDC